MSGATERRRLLDPKQELLIKIRKDIDEIGWSAIGVFPTEDDPGTTFTYTIGLRDTWDHPEMIVVGLQSELAHGILSSAITGIKEGKKYGPGKYQDLISDPEGAPMDALIRVVPTPGRPLNWARMFHGKNESALQIMWPDENGKFPGEKGYDETRFPQPRPEGDTDEIG